MRTIFGSPVLWLGVALFVIGAGILQASTMYAESQGDMNPNPVVAGMLAGCMFLLSFPLILVGLGLGVARWRGWWSPGFFGALVLGLLLLVLFLRAIFWFL